MDERMVKGFLISYIHTQKNNYKKTVGALISLEFYS